MKIGIFDSGLGGLSVLKKIKEKINFADIIYYGDSANSPYGNKSVEEIQKFSLNIGNFLIDNRVDIIVVACNTATVAALKVLQDRFTSIPIVGVILPGASTAVKKSENKKIGIIGTPVTINSNVYVNEIKKINPSIDVYQKSCDLLCPLIEEGWESKEENKSILKEYLKDLPEDIDTLVLGCTHYPFIEDDIRKERNIKIVDPAEETSMHVLFELNRLALKMGYKKLKKSKILVDYFVTGNLEQFKKIGEKFLGEKIEEIYMPIKES